MNKIHRYASLAGGSEDTAFVGRMKLNRMAFFFAVASLLFLSAAASGETGPGYWKAHRLNQANSSFIAHGNIRHGASERESEPKQAPEKALAEREASVPSGSAQELSRPEENLKQENPGESGSEAEHETGELAFPSRLIRFLGLFHPVAVHFPVALILAACLAELLFVFFRRDLFADSARFLTALSAPAAIFAVSLGLAAASSEEFSGAYREVVEWHEHLAFSTAALALAALVFSELSHRKNNPRFKTLYRLALFAAAALVTATGYFGGQLVHGIGHYQW